MPSPRSRQMTPEEYLAFERRSRFRHEYVDGIVYAMSGTTLRHAKLVGNCYTRLRGAAAGSPCQIVTQNLKVHVDATKYYYPDVLAVCGPTHDDADIIAQPCLVIEVTSPRTRATDHREKLIAYRTIPMLRTYLIVSHWEPLVDRYWRGADGAWQHEVITPESGGRVAVPCPDAVLTLAEIYEAVTLPPRLRRLREAPPPYTTAR